MEEWIAGGIGIMLGAGAAWLALLSGRKSDRVRMEFLQRTNEALQDKEKRFREEHIALVREQERLREKLRLAEEDFARRREETAGMQELMAERFRNMASEILEDKSRRFTETNRENIERILQPLNRDIGEFRKKVEETYHRESAERTLLERKIAELAELNNRLRLDAENLTGALKGNSKVQGDWGEMILERILENSGLVKGREYFIQETLRDGADRPVHGEGGSRLRPDVVIVYPDRRKVIVDSKVSLTAYVNYCNAASDGEREAALKAHLQSVRKHIDELADKEYYVWSEDTLDFVMMFVPNESSYTLAMQADPALWSEAYRRRVLLLSPANLIVSLKLTADLWSREYQNRNAREIAERGAKLYDKCVAFLESFAAVGESMRKTREVYDQALGRLKEGNGNLIGQTLKLKELGVKSRKSGKEISAEFIPAGNRESESPEDDVVKS